VKLQACKLKMLTVNLEKFHTLRKYTTPVNKMETIILRGVCAAEMVYQNAYSRANLCKTTSNLD
jgi:hypothetical protein